jgi:peptide/nickel transport system permease protein
MMGFRRRFAPVLLALIHGAALFAPFLCPYDPVTQHREFSYAPPTRIHWIDRDGRFHLRPFVYPDKASESRPYPIRWFVHGYRYRLLGLFPCNRHVVGVNPGAGLFLLGTDLYGRDQLSRLIEGGRISLAAAWAAAALSLLCGTISGAIAGYYGGWTDDLIMRAGELCMSVPWLYLLLAARAFLPLNVPAGSGYLLIVGLVGILGWARPARLIRGVVLAIREQGYVTAARGFGATTPYLLRVHILPETLSVAVTQAVLLVPQYIMAEVTLSFLGLGIDEPAPSWGNLLAGVQHYYVLSAYWWMLLPAIPPVLVSLCCFSMGDALLARRKPAPL